MLLVYIYDAARFPGIKALRIIHFLLGCSIHTTSSRPLLIFNKTGSLLVPVCECLQERVTHQCIVWHHTDQLQEHANAYIQQYTGLVHYSDKILKPNTNKRCLHKKTCITLLGCKLTNLCVKVIDTSDPGSKHPFLGEIVNSSLVSIKSSFFSTSSNSPKSAQNSGSSQTSVDIRNALYKKLVHITQYSIWQVLVNIKMPWKYGKYTMKMHFV